MLAHRFSIKDNPRKGLHSVHVVMLEAGAAPLTAAQPIRLLASSLRGAGFIACEVLFLHGGAPPRACDCWRWSTPVGVGRNARRHLPAWPSAPSTIVRIAGALPERRYAVYRDSHQTDRHQEAVALGATRGAGACWRWLPVSAHRGAVVMSSIERRAWEGKLAGGSP